VWLRARTSAVADAKSLMRTGVHKSVINRILEPYMWHTVVITATAWDNFFALRANPMAQPEIRVAAEEMLKVYEANTPTLIGEGGWHLPYIQGDEMANMPLAMQVQVSAARCARVSYLTQNGVRDHEQDVQLYDRLTSATPMHASPLEHVATPSPTNKHQVVISSVEEPDKELELTLPVYGNLLGWHQHRFDVEAAKQYRAFA
jgi:thymidylate synthase ThyX